MNHAKIKKQRTRTINYSEFKQADKTPLIVILDNIRSLNNIGSVFRTSDAFLSKKFTSVVLQLNHLTKTFIKRLLEVQNCRLGICE